MPLATTSPNNLELRKLSVHATPNAVDQFMNSRNFNNAGHTSSKNDDPENRPSTSAQTSTQTDVEKRVAPVGEDEEPRVRSLPPSPYYNFDDKPDESGPPTGKVRRMSPASPTVAQISRFERHTILFSAMVAPSRSRCSSPIRRMLKNRDPCTSCFQPSTTANENGKLIHDIESNNEFGPKISNLNLLI
jgi:hypothetical protein